VREELAAETLALAWKHFLHLARRGKRPEEFVTTLAMRCSQAARAGRRLAGCDPAKDVLSPVARGRHGVRVVRLPERVAAPGADGACEGSDSESVCGCPVSNGVKALSVNKHRHP
jgi:hypothetical protein